MVLVALCAPVRPLAPHVAPEGQARHVGG